MREVYKDYPRALSKAKQLQKHVKKEFAADKMYQKMTDVLTEFTLDAEIEAQQNRETVSRIREEGAKLPAKERLKFLATQVRQLPNQEGFYEGRQVLYNFLWTHPFR